MSDPFGPGQSVANVVTARPADTRTFGGLDTFLQDCINGVGGTPLTAEMFNEWLANMRALMRGNGNLGTGSPVVAEDHGDTMLLRGVQQMIQRGQCTYVADVGAADALVCNPSPALLEYKAGSLFLVKKGASPNATAAPTINFSSLGALALVNPIGGALLQGALAGGGLLLVSPDGAGNARVLTGAVQPLSLAHGQCQLGYVSPTSIKLSPRNGVNVLVAGVQTQIPSGGITAANTGVTVNNVAGQNLSPSTAYLVALNAAGGLEFWGAAAGHNTDTTAGNIGVEVITGYPGRTLIGLVWMNASAQFSAPCTRSWFNRQKQTNNTSFIAVNTTSLTPVEMYPSSRVPFVCWADDAITAIVCGQAVNSSASCGFAAFAAIDASIPASEAATTSSYSSGASNGQLGAASFWAGTLAEGYHQGMIYGETYLGGTASATLDMLISIF
jgi:hypothetical protein